MKIEKLSECKGASRRGSCSDCGISEGESHDLYRLKFTRVSVCLCRKCFNEMTIIIDKHISGKDDTDA